METNKAKRLVVDALAAEIPVIELNMESAIERGNNIQVLGKAEETIPALFEAYYALLSNKKGA